MTQESRTPVTLIGLGEMGTALAEAYLNAGYPTTVWNRTPGKADALVEKGAIRAETLADAVRASPVVIVCVLDYEAVDDVLGQVSDVLNGEVIFNLTNGTPVQARKTAAWAQERGVDYIDGGIMAIPPIIATPHAFLLYSGAAQSAFDTHKQLLEVMGAATYVGADPGLASLLDLALNGAMYGMVGGAVHAITVVGTENVSPQEFTDSLLVPYLTSIAGIIPEMARQIETGKYTEGVSATLAMQQVGFRNIRQAAADQGISTDLLDPIQSLLDRGVAQGHHDHAFASVSQLLHSDAEPPGGTQ